MLSIVRVGTVGSNRREYTVSSMIGQLRTVVNGEE